MTNAIAEIRQAARTLRRSPDFAVAAIIALSLGIAANTAIFSVVNKILLEPLPYPDPDRLVQLICTSWIGDQHEASIPKFLAWRDLTNVFETIAAYDTTGPAVNITEAEFPQSLKTARVSPGYLSLFGAVVLAGRAFSSEDERSGRTQVAIISEALWRARFKASPTAIGSTISLDGQPCQVIGVIAAKSPDPPFDIWLPLRPGPAIDDHISRVRVTARLRPGVRLETAASEVAQTMPWFIRRYPDAPVLFREEFTAIPLRDAIVGNVRPALLLLTGAVAFLLLIACANVASLALARSSRRTPEIAVRSALGAARSLLIRQLLTESILMALASGIIGLALGYGGVRALLAFSPAGLPQTGASGSAITLDWRIFLFTFLTSVASGILFGLLPALSASRADVMSLLKDTPLQSGMGFRRGGARAALVISQVALALVLLVGAGMLIRTFVASRTADRGFDDHHAFTASMSLTGAHFDRTAPVAEFVRTVSQRMKKVSGITAVAAASSLPLEPALTMPFAITRFDQSLVGRYHGVGAWRSVSVDYFDVFRIRLLRGRLFTAEDTQHAAGVVVISRMMLKKYWHEIDANPIGEYIIIGKGIGADFADAPRQIIGVVADTHETDAAAEAAMYVPLDQLPDKTTARNNRYLAVNWAIRTADDQPTRSEIEHDLQQASGLPTGSVRTMREVLAASSARAQFYVLLLSVFGVAALLLAAVGLYGVMSYSVEQRTREIGLRMALGAQSNNIRNMVAWQGLRLALLGIALGVPAALALTRILVSRIFGVKTWDPAVLASVSTLLAVVALAAAYQPSSRATSVNPCESLRR